SRALPDPPAVTARHRPRRRPAAFRGPSIMLPRTGPFSFLICVICVIRGSNVSLADQPVSFTRQIEPILTRAGCNQGTCHGGQHGKGGFRLSLFGFDPAFDYDQIVQSAEGRRVVLSDPERSILLL